MNNGTPTKPLADLCEFRNGLWKGKKPPYVHVGIIRNTNFNADGTLDDSDIAFHDVEVKQFNSRQLQFGDIILEKSGGGPKQPVGRVITYEKQNGKFSFSNFTSIIRVCNRDELDFRYLHRILYWYYTSGVTESMQRRSTGIRNLDFNSYKQLAIPLPPLPEQRRIVGILDEAFAGIATAKANAEKNLQNARALFESHLNAVFTQRGDGWLELPLGEMATFRNGINFTKSSRGELVKIVGVKDFQQHFWAPLEGLDTVTTEGSLPDSDTLQDGDLLFVRSNGNMELIGRSILVGKVADKITHSGFTIRARFNRKGVVPKYVCRFLKSNTARRKMIDSGIGTNIKSLNQATLSSLVVPLPPSVEQTRLANQLEAMEQETQRLESIYKRKLAALDELKKSLLHQAFSGQL